MKSLHLSHCLTGALVGLALWATAPAAEAAPKRLEPRAAAVKHTGRELPADTHVERLVVKFHEGSRVRLRGGSLVALSTERSPAERALLASRGLDSARVEAQVRAVQALVERAPRTSAISRLFQEEEAVLEARKASGEEQSGHQLADLNLYFTVPLLPGTTAGSMAELVASLNALEVVEVAYAEPRAEPAMVHFGTDAAVRSVLAAVDLPPTTPLYDGRQGYLNGAPGGIDARFAWSVPGANGSGVRVVDIEGGWRTTHEDMPALFFQGGTQINDIGWRNHGTAVLGEIVGVANGYGVTGITPAAQAGVASIGSQSTASAISQAAGAAGRGGIILIELHALGLDDGTACTCNQPQCNYIAMEYWQANFDAIATATANGVVVVEAAGNGSANLDAPAYNNAFNRAVRDSGAIIVGASTATTRVPMCWTNFGSRVDVHGWGESVTTLGYGDLFSSGEDHFYTATFSGTSSAAPIVTGAAASLQGAAAASGRGLLDSRAMRSLLAGTGTAQAADARRIGPLPDLRRALTQLRSSCPLLAPGQSLALGQGINACGSFLAHQGDGNVVLYHANRARWASATGGRATSSLVMQGDGNLVLYSTTGAALWSSGTHGNPGARLELEQQCTLVIRSADGRALWSSGSRCVTQACGSLLSLDVLYPGQGITSCNGRASLILQADGNLVLYRNPGVPLWVSGTSGQAPGSLPMQNDGHLVLYNIAGAPVWASGTAGQNGASLYVQDDCNAVIYNTAGQAVWSTRTWCG